VPAVKGHNATLGVPRSRIGVHGPVQFSETIPIFEEQNLFITGVTRDNTGSALASCTVYVFRADMLASNPTVVDSNSSKPFLAATELRPHVTYVWTGVSDGSGNFSAGPFSRMAGSFFAVAWNAAGTVAGVTLNTLVPA
jgi:hypothetical protein